MKKILVFVLTVMSLFADAQSIVPIRGDSIRLEKVGGNAELLIRNSTRSRTGAFLRNKWNGTTEFAFAVDTIYQNAGGDSLVFWKGSIRWAVPAGSNAGGVTLLANLSDVSLSNPQNGQVLKFNGTVWTNAADQTGAGGGGITDLNGSTVSAQSFQTGSAGTDFNISTNAGSGVHTFNIPTASGSNRGLLSSSDWTNFNNKLSTESDPVFGASAASGITAGNISTWNSKLSNITGLVTQGSNITITGSGTSGSPYVITGPAPGITSESDPVWIAAAPNYYTKTNLQTSGQASVHWNNITNAPSFLTSESDPTAVKLTGDQTVNGEKTFVENVATQKAFYGNAYYINTTTGTMGTPPAGVYYVKNDGLPYFKNAAGTEMPLFNTGGTGSVTSFGFTNGNGFTGTVTNATTTPTLSLTYTESDPTAIKNQFASAQTADAWISGSLRADTRIQVNTANNTYPMEVNGDIRIGNSIRTTTNSNRLSLRYDANNGIGMVFGSGNGIQFVELAGYHFLQSIGSAITEQFVISAYTADKGLLFQTKAGTPTTFSSDYNVFTSLDTDGTPPATTGTTRNVIVDANGRMSFDATSTPGSSSAGGSSFYIGNSVVTSPVQFDSTFFFPDDTTAVGIAQGFQGSSRLSVTRSPQTGTFNGVTQDTAVLYSFDIASIAGFISAGSNVTITGAGTIASPYVINSSGSGSTYTFDQSLNLSGSSVTLDNDAASPGNSYVYGTNASGTKGWQQSATMQLTNPANGDILQYQNGIFVNVAPSAGGAETDPIFTASAASGITSGNISTWNAKIANITGHISAGTNVTVTGSGTIASPYVINASGGGSTYTFQKSLDENGGTVELLNDDAAPGNAKVYGTDPSTGVKGWQQSVGVTLTSPTNGQVLTYQNGVFVNSNAGSGGGESLAQTLAIGNTFTTAINLQQSGTTIGTLYNDAGTGQFELNDGTGNPGVVFNGGGSGLVTTLFATEGARRLAVKSIPAADYTLQATDHYIELSEGTNTFTMASATGQDGREIIIRNGFGSAWNFGASNRPVNALNNALTTIPANSVLHIVAQGGTWKIIN